MKVGPDFRYISQVFSNISDKIWALGGGEVFGVIVLIWVLLSSILIVIALKYYSG
jgi:uncharacterized membrane protein